MAANDEGLQALMKQHQKPYGHCGIHCQSLAMKELSPQLGEAMNTAIKTVNYIKTRLLKSTLFQNCARK
jgi:hypothetical protein